MAMAQELATVTPQTLDGEYYYNGQNLGCCLKF